MNRRLHDVMTAQFVKKEVSGTDFVEWDDGVRCYVAGVTTDASGDGIICRGRNLAETAELIPEPAEDVGTWTSRRLDYFSLPPGEYTICADFEQLGDIATICLKVQNSVTGKDIKNVTSVKKSGKLLSSFTIAEGVTKFSIHFYSNHSGTKLAAKCKFSNIMFVRGTYTSDTMPEFEKCQNGGGAALPLSGTVKLASPKGYGQIIICGTGTSGNPISAEYIAHS